MPSNGAFRTICRLQLICTNRTFSFCSDTTRIGVVGDVERVYDARQFPRTLGTRNSPSCVVFRKEKEHEFPRSSRLETYQLS
jgi:hypothetical protein